MLFLPSPWKNTTQLQSAAGGRTGFLPNYFLHPLDPDDLYVWSDLCTNVIVRRRSEIERFGIRKGMWPMGRCWYVVSQRIITLLLRCFKTGEFFASKRPSIVVVIFEVLLNYIWRICSTDVTIVGSSRVRDRKSTWKLVNNPSAQWKFLFSSSWQTAKVALNLLNVQYTVQIMGLGTRKNNNVNTRSLWK